MHPRVGLIASPTELICTWRRFTVRLFLVDWLPTPLLMVVMLVVAVLIREIRAHKRLTVRKTSQVPSREIVSLVRDGQKQVMGGNAQLVRCFNRDWQRANAGFRFPFVLRSGDPKTELWNH